MTTVTTLMLILIAAGIIAAIAGLVYLAVKGWRLYKAAMRVQADVDAHLQVLMEKQELAMQQAEMIETDQIVLQERVAALKQALEKISILTREISEARSRLNPLT